jgi:hypothetical protein
LQAPANDPHLPAGFDAWGPMLDPTADPGPHAHPPLEHAAPISPGAFGPYGPYGPPVAASPRPGFYPASPGPGTVTPSPRRRSMEAQVIGGGG